MNKSSYLFRFTQPIRTKRSCQKTMNRNCQAQKFSGRRRTEKGEIVTVGLTQWWNCLDKKSAIQSDRGIPTHSDCHCVWHSCPECRILAWCSMNSQRSTDNQLKCTKRVKVTHDRPPVLASFVTDSLTRKQFDQFTKSIRIRLPKSRSKGWKYHKRIMTSIPSAHNGPDEPFRQLHWKLPIRLTHVPPFRQGLVTLHSSMS